MITNQVLKSSDRDLFGITIRQNTKNKMLSVSDLQKAYERARFIHGWSDRDYHSITQSKDFLERVYYILESRDLIKLSILGFTEMVEREGIISTLKGLGVWKTTGRGENKMVVADPYIWILLAMELNPMIYAKVVIWLTDSLIFDRIEAGTEFMPMNSAIKSIIDNPDYRKYATAINESVFGEHIRGIRNLASAQELRKIADIEKFITNGIEMGMITNEDQILKSIQFYKKQAKN